MNPESVARDVELRELAAGPVAPRSSTEALQPDLQGLGRKSTEWREILASRVRDGGKSLAEISEARLKTVALQQCLPIVLAVSVRPGAAATLQERRDSIKRLVRTSMDATIKLLQQLKVPAIEGSPLQAIAFQLVTNLVANDWKSGIEGEASDYASLCAGGISQEDVEAIGSLVARHRVVKSDDEVRQEIAILLMRENAFLARQATRLKGAALAESEEEWIYRLSDKATDVARAFAENIDVQSHQLRLTAVAGRLTAAFAVLSASIESSCNRSWPPEWQSAASEFDRSMRLLDAVVDRQAGRLMDQLNGIGRSRGAPDASSVAAM